MSQQIYRQYIDPESAVVKRPEGPEWTGNHPYGDGVWRSSWFYASLMVIHAKDPATYARLQSEHQVDVSLAGRFLDFFSHCCLGAEAWTLPKHQEQQFSRDQLIPLLYLLAVVEKYASTYKPIGKAILKRLIDLDEKGHSLSDTIGGRIGNNIRYMIDVLSDQARYDLDYKADGVLSLISAGDRRKIFKTAFTLALEAYELGGWIWKAGLDVVADHIVAEYSVFNALGAVSLQCIAWGKEDDDVHHWRSNFNVHADDGWGPAFTIVAGQQVDRSLVEAYYTAHVTRQQDNDIIMAQRPDKIRKGVLHPNLKGGPDQWLVLDYVILHALVLLWR